MAEENKRFIMTTATVRRCQASQLQRHDQACRQRDDVADNVESQLDGDVRRLEERLQIRLQNLVSFYL